MVSEVPPSMTLGSDAPNTAALQHGHWRKRANLASGLRGIETFLAAAGFDRAPWLVVGLAAGICAWFVLPDPPAWLTLIAVCIAVAGITLIAARSDGQFAYLRQAIAAMALMVAVGCGSVWTKSVLVGTPPIPRPTVAVIEAQVLSRENRPAEQRIRLIVATREIGTGRAIKVRLNAESAADLPGLTEGAVVRVKARMVPPAPPMLPGGYDFARAAWFSGLAATGSVLGPITVVAPAQHAMATARLQRALSAHVRQHLTGSPGAIAAAFASVDRGAIAASDEDAMRDAGLTHLLSISGLHVSAVIAASYFAALRLLGLLPWLALRVRLPLVAAATGAAAGIGYTILTGAEVPTIRSCIGAVLVLLALALGREALSMRMVAAAAAAVLLFWPEAVIGPSFQMSFGAVMAIVALHGAAPVRTWFAPREEPWWMHALRHLGSLLLTGILIELALMPIGLFHFHRAGAYGALANVVAIPLTTLASMPLIALALLFDAFGAGGPFWWLAGKSLEALLALAHWIAAMPGAVTAMPAMGRGAFALFIAGSLWLALWTGRVRIWGLVPAAFGLVLLATLRAPDVLVSSDGHHVGITGEATAELLVLRDSRSDYTRDNLLELAGMRGATRQLADWPAARCNGDFCAITVLRAGRNWQLLIAQGRDRVDRDALAAACSQADIVIADRRLPRSCRPRWLKADRASLQRSGGLTIDLQQQTVRTVADEQGQHGWWRPIQAGRRAVTAPTASPYDNGGAGTPAPPLPISVGQRASWRPADQ